MIDLFSPLSLSLSAEAFKALPNAKRVARHLSNMPTSYLDQETSDQLAAADDPLIYEFVEVTNDGSGGCLSLGITTILPGTVGNEYYMTKGHFHTVEADGDEIYIVIQGKGRLLLQTRGGESETVEMKPGALSFIPAGWAHRTVNVGAESLVFISIWPAQVGHDYETIEHRHGFPQVVLASQGEPATAENPSFRIE